MIINLTKAAYENPKFVDKYIKLYSVEPKLEKLIGDFSKEIPGKKVLDLGCGPGHDSYIFARLGFDVVGVDYSNEMIRRAKKLKRIKNMPKFVVCDMLNLLGKFKRNYFDAAWVSESLYHIKENNIPKVLRNLKAVLKDNSVCYIGILGGKRDEILVKDEDYAVGTQRRFTLWDKESFSKILKEQGFSIKKSTETKYGKLGKHTVNLLSYFLVLDK